MFVAPLILRSIALAHGATHMPFCQLSNQPTLKLSRAKRSWPCDFQCFVHHSFPGNCADFSREGRGAGAPPTCSERASKLFPYSAVLSNYALQTSLAMAPITNLFRKRVVRVQEIYLTI